MNEQAADSITNPAAKAAVSWGTVGASSAIGHLAHALGIASWAEAAQAMATISGFLAAILTFCYLVDWFLKRIGRPLLVAFGVLSHVPQEPKE